MEIKLTNWTELIRSHKEIYEKCYKRFNWTWALFSQVHKTKPKLHVFSAEEVYKNAAGSYGFLMYFFFASLFSIKLDSQCNRAGAREVTRKDRGLVVLPATEHAFKLFPHDSSEPYKLCNSAYVWGCWGLSQNCECLISKWMQMEDGRCWGSKEIFKSLLACRVVLG